MPSCPTRTEGREAAALVKSGRRPALSVEFFALSDRRVSKVREVEKAFIEAAALCREGVYDQARVEVRSREIPQWL